jgi:hypothetical protein
MSWSYARATARIAEAINNAPQVRVELFESQYLPRVLALRAQLGEREERSPSIRDLSPGDAILVDTVQVYVNVVNYDAMRMDAGRETEASHARALSFLHLHYAALDRTADRVGAQRVDFHGPRMHAVLVIPDGDDPESRRDAVRRGLELAGETIALSEAASRDLVRGSTTPVFRVGIDVGRCVAIDSGRKDEREPLFIGGAANHAARLADGERGGIYPSDRVRRLFSLREAGGLAAERLKEADAVEAAVLGSSLRLSLDDVESRAADLRAEMRQHRDATIGTQGFVFHHHQPPLRSIKYAQLSPSRSIRMPLGVDLRGPRRLHGLRRWRHGQRPDGRGCPRPACPQI